ncbi:Glycosyltransferases involved in cell wall biogenesis [Archaeoglobus sulfaticallidus PM70-1]|uniref:Glycosyltransferases involved in cell wall biogenesis n=1 Tax=Archaeoglobus sulfaticallidus PM70-1 TaxID=387631 RepID=N0BM45_9EURY|nr:dolichyl-phosphate beta-glucosyltransferase [Archaeoglobus sulfaticallidus]AGK61671.1 Glycosyltransferases involved in cell wall biogenesis [Archaeoglobus sulfaticallidus PM70-1]
MKNGSMARITIVLPAYNEADKLEIAVEEVRKEMSKYFSEEDYEIIIAEDGSTDGTDVIARNLAERYDNVFHVHSDERLGKGRAILNAFRQSKGDVLVFMDVDLSTDISHLKELIDLTQNYDFVTGSRLLKDSETERPFKRDFASKGYNFLVRLLLRSKLKDHQCGFKAFRRKAFFKVVEHVKDNHWFWDTELMILAQRMGYRVKEFPVRWRQGERSKVRFRDMFYMISSIVRMFLK